jgi:protein-S-isoprenylcysteine O-methyltransferase Ste14
MMFVSYLIGIFLTIKNIAMLPLWFYYVGILLMVTGILVRQWAIIVLGHFFTVTVGVQKGHKVVDNGPYRLVRHPSYLGLLLILAGTGFAVCSWGGVLVLMVMNGLAIGYRINVEEKVLVSELGDDYVRYMKNTKRLIPFVY